MYIYGANAAKNTTLHQRYAYHQNYNFDFCIKNIDSGI